MVPSVYTLMNIIYLSHCTKVADGTEFRKHTEYEFGGKLAEKGT